VDGRRVARTFATLGAAVRWRDDAHDALVAGAEPPGPLAPPPPPTAPVSVADLARAFGAGIRAGTVRARDGRTYTPSGSRRIESLMRLHVLPRIGATPAVSLTRKHVQRMVDALAAEKGPETARKARGALAAVMRLAEDDDLIERSPVEGIRVPQQSGSGPSIRPLTPGEASRILHAAARDDAARGRSLAVPLFGLILATGLRLGEALALRWAPHHGDDGGLHLDDGVVRVRWSLDRQRDRVTREIKVGPPKSRAGVREVPMGTDDVAMMRRHRLATGRPDDGALVFSVAGAPILGTGDPSRTWRRLVAMAEVSPAPRIHDLRHTWCVFALRAGVRPEAVAKLGGWADVGMVHRRYGRHALPDETAGAAELLATWRASHGG
ncbi:MAG: site-specific integrase, partial [Miltoncostaeaceae bacterium]